jgi:flagellum-specific peptidoglycan hydrolase FlgJ
MSSKVSKKGQYNHGPNPAAATKAVATANAANPDYSLGKAFFSFLLLLILPVLTIIVYSVAIICHLAKVPAPTMANSWAEAYKTALEAPKHYPSIFVWGLLALVVIQGVKAVIPTDVNLFQIEESFEFIAQDTSQTVIPVPASFSEDGGNDAAPVTPKEGKDAEVQAYIKRFAKTAVAEMHKYGIPASITLAQGIVESRYGTSTLAVKANNHFGIKCFAKKCQKGHCTNHTDDSHKDFFVKYPNAWGSYRAHSLFLKNSARYTELFTYGEDYAKWAHGLKRCGYATDPNYANKIISTIKKYKLYRYDKK